ncbi:MAG: hypothetical protein ACRD5K_02990 [Candidatus Acidiferrales bacterium]
MRCPKCQFDHPLQTTECLKCGIVFSKYQPPPSPIDGPAKQLDLAFAPAPDAVEASAKQPDNAAAASLVSSLAASLTTALSSEADKSPVWTRDDFVRELKCRALALPLALLAAYWLTGTGFNMVAGMLSMVVHESGHAITAWLTGRWAVPMPWVTMHGQNRSWFIVLVVTSVIVCWGFHAWRTRRWGWVCAAVLVLLLQLDILSLSAFKQEALIVFGGEGGAMVLATILMATFYASRESALCKSWGLRWGLLVLGALALMHVYRSWSGPWGNIPFGEIEGVNLSDPSLLTEMYGWSVTQMVDRYIELARVCFGAMGAIYVWGLASAYVETRLPAPLPSHEAHKGLEIQASR